MKEERTILPMPESLNVSCTFKRKTDGTIDLDDIRLSVWCALCYLYDHGLTTAKPSKVTVNEYESTNILNETYNWISIATYFDKPEP